MPAHGCSAILGEVILASVCSSSFPLKKSESEDHSPIGQTRFTNLYKNNRLPSHYSLKRLDRHQVQDHGSTMNKVP